MIIASKPPYVLTLSQVLCVVLRHTTYPLIFFSTMSTSAFSYSAFIVF